MQTRGPACRVPALPLLLALLLLLVPAAVAVMAHTAGGAAARRTCARSRARAACWAAHVAGGLLVAAPSACAMCGPAFLAALPPPLPCLCVQRCSAAACHRPPRRTDSTEGESRGATLVCRRPESAREFHRSMTRALASSSCCHCSNVASLPARVAAARLRTAPTRRRSVTVAATQLRGAPGSAAQQLVEWACAHTLELSPKARSQRSLPSIRWGSAGRGSASTQRRHCRTLLRVAGGRGRPARRRARACRCRRYRGGRDTHHAASTQRLLLCRRHQPRHRC